MNHYNGFNGYSDLDDYGKLFGQGGWFQKTFRPSKYADFEASQLTFQPTEISDMAVADTPDSGFTTTEPSTGQEKGKLATFFSNLFGGGKERRAARQQRRAAKAGQRSLEAASRAGRELVDPNDSSYKYKRQADGSYAVFRRQADGTFRRTGTARAGTGAHSAIDQLFPAGGIARDQSDRAMVAADIIGGVASAVPGILSVFGIGPSPGAGMPMEDLGPLPQQQKPFPWIPVTLGVGALFLVVMATRKPQQSAPAPAPAPRRRRTR